jgi:hypothetical protein
MSTGNGRAVAAATPNAGVLGALRKLKGRRPAELRERGAQARATAGDSEPLLALQDALATFPADRVVVFVRDEDAARYREDDVIGEAERRFGVPVTEVTA